MSGYGSTWRSYPWNGGRTPRNLMEGGDDADFHARTLWISATSPGLYTLVIRGLSSDATRDRLVCLANGQTKRIDVSDQQGTKVVLADAPTDGRCVIVATTHALTGQRADVGYVAIPASVGAEMPVPPGAVEVYAATPDAGFLWRTSSTGGGVADIPDPLVATTLSVKGIAYVATVAQPLVWRIEL